MNENPGTEGSGTEDLIKTSRQLIEENRRLRAENSRLVRELEEKRKKPGVVR